jgi:hypothetical protein
MREPNSIVKTLIGPFESIKGIPEYKSGLGYSPASGPAVGRPIIGPGHFFQYDVKQLSPKSPRSRFGAMKLNSKPIAAQRLSNLPKPGNYNPVAFPGLGGFKGEVGPGNTPGGVGGPDGVLHYLPAPLGYWGYFGKKQSRRSGVKRRKSRRKSRRKRRSKRRSSRKTRRRSRRKRRSSRRSKRRSSRRRSSRRRSSFGWKCNGPDVIIDEDENYQNIPANSCFTPQEKMDYRNCQKDNTKLRMEGKQTKDCWPVRSSSQSKDEIFTCKRV